MFKKFKKSELALLIVAVLLIFVSEFYFFVANEPLKALFIGLWSPTIIVLLIYLNIKKNQ